jgi:hypothetical protein
MYVAQIVSTKQFQHYAHQKHAMLQVYIRKYPS